MPTVPSTLGIAQGSMGEPQVDPQNVLMAAADMDDHGALFQNRSGIKRMKSPRPVLTIKQGGRKGK